MDFLSPPFYLSIFYTLISSLASLDSPLRPATDSRPQLARSLISALGLVLGRFSAAHPLFYIFAPPVVVLLPQTQDRWAFLKFNPLRDTRVRLTRPPTHAHIKCTRWKACLLCCQTGHTFLPVGLVATVHPLIIFILLDCKFLRFEIYRKMGFQFLFCIEIQCFSKMSFFLAKFKLYNFAEFL